MKLHVLALAVMMSFLPAMQAGAEGDALQYFKETDPGMKAAISAARRTMPEFLAQAGKGDLSSGAFLVKWAKPLEDGGREHIWVTVDEITENSFMGFLAKEPVNFAASQGDAVTVPADETSDWAYWDEAGMMHGSYTTRVMLGQLSAEERAQFEAILAPLPKEN